MFSIVTIALLIGQISAVPLFRDSLSNGFVVLTYEDHRLPVVDIRFVCRSGAAYDPRFKSGLANLTAKMLLRGTENMKGDSVADILEFLGTKHSAGADHDYSYLDIKTLSRSMDQVLDILSDAVLNPAFRPEAFSREQAKALTAAQRGYDNPRLVVMTEFDRLLFGNHPYASEPWGDTATLRKLKPEDSKTFYQTCYLPNNSFIIIVGDTKHKDILKSIRNRFSKWQPGTIKKLHVPEIAYPKTTRVKLITRPDFSQTCIMLGHPGISISDPQMLSTRLMSFILGGSALGSRLGQAVREKAGLAYDVRCWFDRRAFMGAYRATVQTVNPKPAIEKMLAEIRRMHSSGPTEKELEAACNYYTGSFPLRYSSSNGKLYQITRLELYNLGTDWLDTFPDKINALTLSDLKTSAREHLHPGKYLIVIVGNITRNDLDLPDAEWIN